MVWPCYAAGAVADPDAVSEPFLAVFERADLVLDWIHTVIVLLDWAQFFLGDIAFDVVVFVSVFYCVLAVVLSVGTPLVLVVV